jgi:hypothetical protein
MLSLEELRKFEWVSFCDCRTNVREKRSGARIGDYLAISGFDNKWLIFSTLGGRPVINACISSLQDAEKIAKFINKSFGDYLGIYELWPNADVIGIARLSVPNGELIYNALCGLVELGRTVSYQDFINILAARVQ